MPEAMEGLIGLVIIGLVCYFASIFMVDYLGLTTSLVIAVIGAIISFSLHSSATQEENTINLKKHQQAQEQQALLEKQEYDNMLKDELPSARRRTKLFVETVQESLDDLKQHPDSQILITNIAKACSGYDVKPVLIDALLHKQETRDESLYLDTQLLFDGFEKLPKKQDDLELRVRVKLRHKTEEEEVV